MFAFTAFQNVRSPVSIKCWWDRCPSLCEVPYWIVEYKHLTKQWWFESMYSVPNHMHCTLYTIYAIYVILMSKVLGNPKNSTVVSLTRYIRKTFPATPEIPISQTMV